MAKKSYGIENLSYQDQERVNDYMLENSSGSSKFNMPTNISESSYMFPSQLTEFICVDTLIEQDTQIDNN